MIHGAILNICDKINTFILMSLIYCMRFANPAEATGGLSVRGLLLSGSARGALEGPWGSLGGPWEVLGGPWRGLGGLWGLWGVLGGSLGQPPGALWL